MPEQERKGQAPDAARAEPVSVPVVTEADGVHAEPRKTGRRLADLSIALSAIVISLISLAVAIHHGRVQQRLVAANSWPFLTALTSNDFGDGHQTFSLAIMNSGVGPAVLQKLVVRYRGEPVGGWLELLQRCCGVARDITLDELQAIGFESGGRPKNVIRPSEPAVLLRLARLPDRPQIWERFTAARLDLSFEACYCSIIGECWESDLQSLDPQPAGRCEATPQDYVEIGAGLDDAPVLPVMQGPATDLDPAGMP